MTGPITDIGFIASLAVVLTFGLIEVWAIAGATVAMYVISLLAKNKAKG